MKAHAPMEQAGTIAPAVHLEFIQNQAGLSENAGLEEIESYHRALFMHHHAPELERYRQQARTHEERLAHLQTRLAGAQTKLGGMESMVVVTVEGEPDTQPTAPWNAWDRAMFVAAALGIAGLIVFGVLNISFNLLESGLVTFIESPVRAYFWAALLPVGALAVKIGWDLLRSRRLRDFYQWACLVIGVVSVLVWLGAYAIVYPTLSKTTQEHLAGISVFDESRSSALGGTSFAGAKWIDAATVVSQATAEIFLSAVLGMYMTSLYLRHRPVRLAGNPLFRQLDEERQALERDVERERMALAEAQGNQTRLENQLDALLAFARSLFHRETGLQRDQTRQKRALLDQISQQLRSQLESVENGRLAGPSDEPAVANPNHNGRGNAD